VGVVTRPQSGAADFYRELGELFNVKLSPHNRVVGFDPRFGGWFSPAR
jgi:hypothetical protein